VPRVPGLWRAKSSSRGTFGTYTSIRPPADPAFELNGHATAIAFKLLPPSRHSGHGRICCWLDRVAIDPELTLDPNAILTARASFRSCSRFPIRLHSRTGAGLFAPNPMAETKGLRCVVALLLYQTRPAAEEQNMSIRKNNVS
jgi:hypothetical protein